LIVIHCIDIICFLLWRRKGGGGEEEVKEEEELSEMAGK
jgi:hypothetical protein